MLRRVICTAELAGMTGRSTLSIAQILGVSDANNRRDHICAALLVHGGRMVEVIEGDRADLDRLLRRMRADIRLERFDVLSDAPISSRTLTEAAGFCHEPAQTLSRAGLKSLERLTVRDVETMLDYRQAA